VTQIPYTQIQPEPIRIYHHVPSKTIYKVNMVSVYIREPFKDSTSEFSICIDNFTKEAAGLWEQVSGNEKFGVYRFNETKANEYRKENFPEIIIQSSFIHNDIAPVWVPIWVSQPSILIKTREFLKHSAFDTWECMYVFDTRFTGLELNGETYLTIGAKSVIISLKIPKAYTIENTENLKIELSEDSYLIKKELSLGETFHLVVKDPIREKIKRLISFTSPLVAGAVIGILIGRTFNI